MNCLVRPQDVGGGNTSARDGDVECLGEFDEFRAGYISTPDEDGHLQSDARRASGRGKFHELPLLESVDRQGFFLMIRQPPRSTLCPYTTRFRSKQKTA